MTKSLRSPTASPHWRRMRAPVAWKVPTHSAARADPHPLPQQLVDPLAQLARRLVGEGDRQDAARVGARRHQARQPVGDDARLARPRARHHQQRLGRMHHRVDLRRVQLAASREKRPAGSAGLATRSRVSTGWLEAVQPEVIGAKRSLSVQPRRVGGGARLDAA